MKKQKSRKSPYSGTDLAKSLKSKPSLLGHRTEEQTRELAVNLELLFSHYRIDPTTETAWHDLCLALAEQHVPAFIYWKVGRKPDIWTPERRAKLYRDVRRIMEEKGCDASTACYELTQRREWQDRRQGKIRPDIDPREYGESAFKDIYDQECAAHDRIDKARAALDQYRAYLKLVTYDATLPVPPSLLAGDLGITVKMNADTGKPLTLAEQLILAGNAPAKGAEGK
jgi:hypothetical protein